VNITHLTCLDLNITCFSFKLVKLSKVLSSRFKELSMILVTGGCGYVGSHFIAQYLKAKPHERVAIVDDLSLGHQEVLSAYPAGRVTLYQGRIGDSALIDSILEKEKVEAVVHFAARAYVGESQENPFLYFERNVVDTLRFLEALNKHKVNRLVFSSTCSTFGDPVYSPIDEEHPQKPINTYGMSKLMLEEALRALGMCQDLRFVILRYFNAAGASLDASIGESHEPETHLLPLAIQAALGKRGELSIFGNDYETADGTCVRDYVHVLDLASAHLAALDLLGAENFAGDAAQANGRGLAVNLGTSTGSSVLEVVKAIEAYLDKPVPYKFVPRRSGDPAFLVADNRKAREKLGFSSQFNLAEIVASACRWELNRRY
jgi:UDP-glucose-4-epimerase GalE